MQAPEFNKPRIEEGIYEAHLSKVKELSEGQFGKRIAWIFLIPDAKPQRVELAKVTYLNATPNSECTKVLLALGYEYEKGKTFNTEELMGKKVRVWVEDFQRSKEEDPFSTIAKVKPLKSELVEEELVQ